MRRIGDALAMVAFVLALVLVGPWLVLLDGGDYR
jgi:hypothetical protein